MNDGSITQFQPSQTDTGENNLRPADLYDPNGNGLCISQDGVVRDGCIPTIPSQELRCGAIYVASCRACNREFGCQTELAATRSDGTTEYGLGDDGVAVDGVSPDKANYDGQVPNPDPTSDDISKHYKTPDCEPPSSPPPLPPP